jgi:hypothetical protein
MVAIKESKQSPWFSGQGRRKTYQLVFLIHWQEGKPFSLSSSVFRI